MKPAPKKVYVGNCVTSFDADDAMILDVYSDPTEFAQGVERAVVVPSNKLVDYCNVPAEVQRSVRDHETAVLVDKECDVVMLHDLDDDIHYFFM